VHGEKKDAVFRASSVYATALFLIGARTKHAQRTWIQGRNLATQVSCLDAWLRDGSNFASGDVTGYRVTGMPDGAWARIANFGAPNRNDWRIMRINGDTRSEWTGHHEGAQVALTELSNTGA
jgi:hypothetical protein